VVSAGEPSLANKVTQICTALVASDIPYALGGALALAFATEEPRGTRDIDVNVFVDANRAESVFAALPVQVTWAADDVATARRDDQVRLYWDDTPIDIFFAAAPFHFVVGRRARTVELMGQRVRVLSANDLAIFKVLFDRTKDWADIEAMNDSDAIDITVVANTLLELLGDDDRITRLQTLRSRFNSG
jgi:hypothetical protein